MTTAAPHLHPSTSGGLGTTPRVVLTPGALAVLVRALLAAG